MLSEDIHSITCALKHRLREDGQVRMLKKEAQAFIANLESCFEQARALERAPLSTHALRRHVVREEAIDRFRRAGGL